MLLPSALGFSPHLPVSVCGTGPYQAIVAFLGGQLIFFPTLWFGIHHAFPLPGGFSSLTGSALGPVSPLPAKTF